MRDYRTVFLRAVTLALTLSVSQASLNAASMEGALKANDDTGVNKRDQSPNELTADQAKENPTDREIAQKIRRAVVADKQLSLYAHNVKIISVGGRVTLKGPVRSEIERTSIMKKAAIVVGAQQVVDEMSIEPENKK